LKSRADLKNQQVGSLLTSATACVIDPAPSQLRSIQRLHALRQRLETDRFQLAVLGQFKRGKSTLLNALIGTSVLPTAVVPLTAIPTFVEAGAVPCVRSIFASGARREISAEQPEQLADPLAQLVTEEANPNNRLGLARVEVSLPVPLLESGVVLIDTPGVGSTFTHNTERAEAVLPECDAALFVVSPEPPITEVEISYLARIQATVARLIIVLNKIDNIEPQDLAKTVAFLREVLAQKAAVDQSVPLFLVSARVGLLAKMRGDKRALSSSGLPELEMHLGDFLAREKRSALEAAVALKANTIIDQLLMETEMRLQALRLPTEDLSQRIATFDSALAQFDDERRILSDLLAGDRERTLERIEKDAGELRLRARIVLEAELDRTLARSDGADAARNAMLPIVNEFFEAELDQIGKSFQERLTAILDVHRQRMNELIELVRRTAANLINVTLRITKDAEALEFRHEPYWVLSGQMPTLNPIAPGKFDSLLPASVRRARVRRRLRQEINTIVQRNVENLRWATRQNVEDAFRRFGRALDESFATNIEATRGIIVVAYDRRLRQAERTETEIAAVEASKTTLMDIQTELRSLV
jgi:small GTP-binding protein